MMSSSKTQSYECCMCGDQGLSHELFRCKVCHFRSQHRYCSNLYPKEESYRVCNWCLIQKDDNPTTTNNTTTTTLLSNNNSSPTQKHNTTPTSKTNNKLFTHLGGPKAGPGPKGLQPTSPIKKPMMKSQEAQTPSSRKRITAVNCPTTNNKDDRLRRTKSFDEMSNNYSSNNNSTNSKSSPGVIKHVFRNKVRRYKLLDEVSS